MSFQNIPPVDKAAFYIDLALRRSREKGENFRSQKLKGNQLQKSRYLAIVKMQVVADTISSRMEGIVKSFPAFDTLPPFYQELVRVHVDYPQLKKSLAAVNWVRGKSQQFFRIYSSKVNKTTRLDHISTLRGEFIGRLSSLVKQVKDELVFLEQFRRILKEFPVIKTGMKTVALVGFPNAGKTTLLYKLTGSKPEISSYAFTTKGINVGYSGEVQFLDTPGTLNRFEKMNSIEKIAYLAMKHCAEKLVFVFDLSEEYPLEQQEKLLKKIKEESKKPILLYVSKTDILEKKIVEPFLKKYPESYKDVEELKKDI